MKKYEILWTDMHSNLHHEDMKELPVWYEHAKQLLDFWPIAYYPYYMRKLPSGMGVEDVHDLKEVEKDWEELRDFVQKVNQEEDWPMFMGYEWQGSGKDGDHNVFFRDNDATIQFPLRYDELYNSYKNIEAIAIPHHLAYQSENRGKNWDTHIEAFSPFAEVYSSHGSSENDDGPVPMTRHVHMGPRVGNNSVEAGLKRGYHFGLIASGDNHSVPAVSKFGTMALLSTGRDKESIWDAMCKRHVYGVSEERIELDFRIDEAVMGDQQHFHEKNQIDIQVKGCNELDRIELLGNEERIQLIDCGSNELLPENGIVRFQWKIEFGWGPDRRVFPDIAFKKWNVALNTQGKILRVVPCWNNFGQKQITQNDKECEWELTTYKTTHSGKWMGVSAVTTEAMILEMECDINELLILQVDGKEYTISVRQILTDSTLISLDEEISKLLYSTYHEEKFYRNDTWWHNSYKFKIHKGALQHQYEQKYQLCMDLRDYHEVRIRVHQKNGFIAWSSPIFKKEED